MMQIHTSAALSDVQYLFYHHIGCTLITMILMSIWWTTSQKVQDYNAINGKQSKWISNHLPKINFGVTARGYNNVIHYHKQFAPHWKKIAKLIVHEHENVNGLQWQCLYISGIQLHLNLLNIMLPAMQSTQHLIALSFFKIHWDAMEWYLSHQFIRRNLSSEKIILEWHQPDDVDAMKSFSVAVKRHPCLKKLLIETCQFGIWEW